MHVYLLQCDQYILRFSYLAVIKIAKYKKLWNDWSYCTQNRAVINAYHYKAHCSLHFDNILVFQLLLPFTLWRNHFRIFWEDFYVLVFSYNVGSNMTSIFISTLFYTILLCIYGIDIKQWIEKKRKPNSCTLTHRFCESIAFTFCVWQKTL